MLWIVEHRGDYYVDDARSRKEFSPPDIASLTTPSHPAKLFLTSADPLRGIVGLCGTPNSCYVQSILQCFLATLPLVKFACSENSPSILHEKTAIRTCLYAILENFIREVWIGEYSSPEASSSVKADLTIHYILGNKIGRTLSYPDLFERLQSAVEERSRGGNQQDVTDCYNIIIEQLVCISLFYDKLCTHCHCRWKEKR